MNNRRRRVAGVTVHRRRDVGSHHGGRSACGAPPSGPRSGPREWARTDRTAALLVCLAVQQRLVAPEPAPRRVAHGGPEPTSAAPRRRHPRHLRRGPLARRARLRPDVPSRRAAAAEPGRSVRTGPGGRVYLDVAWEDIGLVVEIDGGHHALALNPVDDALRQNEVTLSADMVLRIPVLGPAADPRTLHGPGRPRPRPALPPARCLTEQPPALPEAQHPARLAALARPRPRGSASGGAAGCR